MFLEQTTKIGILHYLIVAIFKLHFILQIMNQIFPRIFLFVSVKGMVQLHVGLSWGRVFFSLVEHLGGLLGMSGFFGGTFGQWSHFDHVVTVTSTRESKREIRL